jgi:hypothetical protein
MKNIRFLVLLAVLISPLATSGGQSALALAKPGLETDNGLQGTRAYIPASIVVAETTPKEKPKETDEEEEELGEDDC